MATRTPDRGRASGTPKTGTADGAEVQVVRRRADEMAPFGWAPLWVLVAVAFVDRIETNIVPAVLTQLQDEWGFGDFAGGAIPFAAAIAGLIVTVPAGYWADRYTRTRLVAVVVASWALLTMLSGLAVGFVMFFMIRTVLGAADNIDNPSVSSLIADYFPPKVRARAYGLQRMAFYLGGSIGVIFGGIVAEVFGWRVAFFLMILPGLAVAGLLWIMREPVRGAIDRFVGSQQKGAEVTNVEANEQAESWIKDAEGGDTGAALGRGTQAAIAQLKELFRIKTCSMVYIGLLTFFIGTNGIFFWLPTYYQRFWDLEEGAAGLLTGLVGIVGILGGVYVGGWLGDRWHRVRAGGRILICGAGLFIGSLLLFTAIDTPWLWAQFIAITTAVFFLALAIPNMSAALADIIRANLRGMGFGVLTFLATFGTAVGPLLVGGISEAVGDLRVGMYFLVAPSVIGGFIVLLARKTYDDDAEHVLQEAARR